MANEADKQLDRTQKHKPLKPQEAHVADKADKWHREQDRVRPDVDDVRHRPHKVHCLLPGADILLSAPEDGVLVDDKEVAALEPTEALAPHRARLQRHLQP